jgi:hypothetical protein
LIDARGAGSTTGAVIPAKAGTHFDLDFPVSIFAARAKMDSGFRRNDEVGSAESRRT